jgi:bacillithiol synthase
VQTRLPLAQFPAANKFLQDYADPAQWAGALSGWFHYNPHDSAAFAARIDELQGRADLVQRAEFAASVAAKQRTIGAGEQSIRNAELLAEPNTYTVVAGQQAGLFGGPLYTQLKAVSAIVLARRLAAQFPDSHVVPVFWIASGDSDFEEVRRSYVLDKNGEVAGIELPPNGTHWDNEIIAQRAVSTTVSGALEQLAAALPGGEYRAEVLAEVQQLCSQPHLNESFARYMARLFRETGLVIVEPDYDTRRYGPHQLIKSELQEPQRFALAVQQRDAEIAAAGYPVQVQTPPGDTNVYFLRDGRRFKISSDGGTKLRATGEKLDLFDGINDLGDKGQHFLCSALLGPVYQDALLRPLAFIGGGAELAYRAQSTALAAAHGIKLAPAFLRATATLLPQKNVETAVELKWELPDLFRPRDEVVKAAIAKDRPEEIAAALEAYLGTLHTADARLREVAVAFDPALEETFETLRGNLIRHLEKLDKKITASLKQRSEARVRKVTTLHNQVYPRGQVQERELSLLSFLPRYGFEIISQLEDKLEFPSWEHQLIVL